MRIPPRASSTRPRASARRRARFVVGRVVPARVARSDWPRRIQPPSSRVPGPACFYSTALWLRAAFAGLHYDIHHAVATGDLVAVNSTMNGRHVEPWAVYADDGTIDTVFPPTNKIFAMTQSHWFKIKDGVIIEHWANRDDLGTARQLGWIPPTPIYLVKMALAKRRAAHP